MLGWMDDEALARTLTTGRATYWSRSPAGVLGQGRDLGPPAVGARGPAGLRRRHAAGPGRPGGTGLPHRRPDLLRRRRAARGAARARWLSPTRAAGPSARSSAPALAAAALAAVAGHQPWASGTRLRRLRRAVRDRRGRPGAGRQRAGPGGARLLGRAAGDPRPGPPGRRGARRPGRPRARARRSWSASAAPRSRSATPTTSSASPTPTSSRTGVVLGGRRRERCSPC